MKYSGEYTMKVKNGKVKIPWKNKELKNAEWALVEIKYKDGDICVYLTIEPHIDPNHYDLDYLDEGDQVTIIQSGTLDLSSHYLWKLPQKVIEFLEYDDMIVFTGGITNITVVSKKANDKLIADLNDALAQLAKEYEARKKRGETGIWGEIL